MNKKILSILGIAILLLIPLTGCVNREVDYTPDTPITTNQAYYNYCIKNRDYSNGRLVEVWVRVINEDYERGIKTYEQWWKLIVDGIQYDYYKQVENNDWVTVLPGGDTTTYYSYKVPLESSTNYKMKYSYGDIDIILDSSIVVNCG